ncbi:MAG: hypothetical protein QW689_07810 [Nitrososphaerota archaeon]
MLRGVRLNSKGRSEHAVSGLVCGLDVHKGCCDAMESSGYVYPTYSRLKGRV